MTSNGITPEAVDAAAKAVSEVAHTRDFGEMARAALEAARDIVSADIQETLAGTVRAARRGCTEQARLDREFARAAMEADLNKHFPLIEDWLDGEYQMYCDATGCDFSTEAAPYNTIMSQWIGHVAHILSISGDAA